MPDGTKYTGDWVNGRASGHGIKVLPNQTVYDGKWQDGKFLDGRCTYPDGKIYDGKWRDGKPYGFGIKTWPDGRKYEGEWRNAKPVGVGKKVYPDGKEKHGYWDQGKFIEGNAPPGILEKLKQEDEEAERKGPEPLAKFDPDHSMSNKQQPT